MNINFNPLIKNIIPIIIVFSLSYIINIFIGTYLPQEGIEKQKNSNSNIEYKDYNIANAFNYYKEQDVKVQKNVKDYPLISNLTLQAIYAQADAKGWIIILENNSKQTHMLANEDSFKGYTLKSVYPTFVVFSRSGIEYKLELKLNDNVSYEKVVKDDETNKIKENIKVSGNKIEVKRNFFNTYVNDMDKIWNNIAINEERKNGQIIGFRIDYVKPKSAFESLGLVKGDIIKSVNEYQLNSYNDAFKLFGKINELKTLNIKIKRGNKDMEMKYEIN